MSTTHETPEATAEGGKPCIAVVFGGRSSEHSISLITARSVLRAIDRDRWDVVSVGISPDGAWFLCSQEELEALLDIITQLMCELQDEGICRIQPVGALSTLPAALQEQLECSARRTADNPGPHLNIAVGYGGRQEIVDAVREVLADAAARGESLTGMAESLSVEHISDHLYTRGQPDPDLLIRTSGEQRLSGFLMWQSAYSEFYFCEALWPDFRRVDFLRALRDYARRQRRFGG